MQKYLLLFAIFFFNPVKAGRTVLVVSNVLEEDGGDFSQPVVEVYDFLSRTWRLFEPPAFDGDVKETLPNLQNARQR